MRSTYDDVQRPNVPMFKDQWSMSNDPIPTTFKNGNTAITACVQTMISTNQHT